MTYQMNDESWLMKQIEHEGNGCILGGNLVRLQQQEKELSTTTRKLALAKLIAYARREKGMNIAEFATFANIDEQELLAIENGEISYYSPRTIWQLSQSLGLSQKKLGELAGISQSREIKLAEATIQFAAYSETVAGLSPEEQEALHGFVSYLSEGD